MQKPSDEHTQKPGGGLGFHKTGIGPAQWARHAPALGYDCRRARKLLLLMGEKAGIPGNFRPGRLRSLLEYAPNRAQGGLRNLYQFMAGGTK